MMTPLHLLLALLPCMMVMAGPQPAYDPVLSLLQKYPAYSSYFISRWVSMWRIELSLVMLVKLCMCCKI